jgi:hypothetical protein
MKNKIWSVLVGIGLTVSLGSIQAAETDWIFAMDDASADLAQTVLLQQDMPGILGDVVHEEIVLMAEQDMETFMGGNPCGRNARACINWNRMLNRCRRYR